MKYLFVLTFIICFVLFDTNIGYTRSSPPWTHFTYQFRHAGIVHLLVNSLSFLAMFRLMEKLVDRRLLAALVLAIGFAASFLAAYDVPTVGASAMVYAMTGMFFSMAGLCRDIRIIDKRKFALFILAILACLIVGAAKGNGNFFLHLFAMMIGMIAGAGIAAFRNR